MRPQTIQIHLPYGDPRGLRQAEITTRTVRAFEVPRDELGRFGKMTEASQPGVYLLFGMTPSGQPKCYIGESDNVGHRLTEHNRGKDFWSRAVAVVSLTNSWTKAHVQCLEQTAIEVAQAARQYDFDNIQSGKSTNIPSWMKADCDEFFDTISVLVATLGYAVFDTHKSPAPMKRLQSGELEPSTSPDFDESAAPGISSPSQKQETEMHLQVNRKGTHARGVWDGSRMTVMAGSFAKIADPRIDHQSKVAGTQLALVAQDVLVREGDRYVFARDQSFSTPSGASTVIVGGSSSGWDDWRNEHGQKLNVLVDRRR